MPDNPTDTTEQTAPVMALAALLRIDDQLCAGRKAVALVRRPDALVALVDTAEAWGAWVHAVEMAAPQQTQVHRGGHLLTAETTVAGWPVLVVKARMEPQPIAVRDLAQELGVTVAAVSRLVSRMCRAAEDKSRVVAVPQFRNGDCVLTGVAAQEIRAELTVRAVA